MAATAIVAGLAIPSMVALAATKVTTYNLSAKGGTIKFTATVKNAKTCAWLSTPKVVGFDTTVNCHSGKITRSARFKANTLTKSKSYSITLTVHGKSTMLLRWKVDQARNTSTAKTTTTTTTSPKVTYVTEAITEIDAWYSGTPLTDLFVTVRGLKDPVGVAYAGVVTITQPATGTKCSYTFAQEYSSLCELALDWSLSGAGGYYQPWPLKASWTGYSTTASNGNVTSYSAPTVTYTMTETAGYEVGGSGFNGVTYYGTSTTTPPAPPVPLTTPTITTATIIATSEGCNISQCDYMVTVTAATTADGNDVSLLGGYDLNFVSPEQYGNPQCDSHDVCFINVTTEPLNGSGASVSCTVTWLSPDYPSSTDTVSLSIGS